MNDTLGPPRILLIQTALPIEEKEYTVESPHISVVETSLPIDEEVST